MDNVRRDLREILNVFADGAEDFNGGASDWLALTNKTFADILKVIKEHTELIKIRTVWGLPTVTLEERRVCDRALTKELDELEV